MAVKRNIALTNMNEDELYVDDQNIVAAKRKIKNDLTNIITDLNNIEKHYKILRDHKATKGSWKTLATQCVKKSNTYEKKMKNDKTSLENAIDDAVQQYVLTQIRGLKAAQTAVDSIDVG